MKPEEAKEIFVKEIKCREIALECEGKCGSCEYSTGWQQLREAMLTVISALEKQIPKKVRVTTSTKRCSVCGRQLSGIGNIHPERNYCQKCGQAIDWGEE